MERQAGQSCLPLSIRRKSMQFAATHPLNKIRRVARSTTTPGGTGRRSWTRSCRRPAADFVFGGPIFLQRPLRLLPPEGGRRRLRRAGLPACGASPGGPDAQDYAMRAAALRGGQLCGVRGPRSWTATRWRPPTTSRTWAAGGPARPSAPKEGRFAYLVTQTPYTPEELRDVLAAAGWDSAATLDGGGSARYRDRAGSGFACDAGPGDPLLISRSTWRTDVSESGHRPAGSMW